MSLIGNVMEKNIHRHDNLLWEQEVVFITQLLQV